MSTKIYPDRMNRPRLCPSLVRTGNSLVTILAPKGLENATIILYLSARMF
jgi:hypothetical protein